MRTLLVLALFSPLALAAPVPKDRKKTTDSIVGSWEIVNLERPALRGRIGIPRNMQWTFDEEGRMSIGTVGGAPNAAYTYKVDPFQSPGHFEFQYNANGGISTPSLGIYKIEDDTLTICYTFGGQPRPTEFGVEPNSVTYTYKRVGGSK